MLGLLEFGHLTYDRERLINFLIQHNVLPNTVKCSNCGDDIDINKETLIFQCAKRYYTINQHRKRIVKRCNFKRSAKACSWFHRTHLDMGTICRLIACFLMLQHPRQTRTQIETGISSPTTIVEWFNFCREICVFWVEKHSEKLGGPGHTVEIGEAKIGKGKYKIRDRLIQGHWIFGGYERDSKRVFIVPVKDRTEKTFLNLIKEWILPGTTIISNCWKSYTLDNESVQHLTVNHSYNFVDTDTGAHTQHIERIWREVRGNIPRYGRREHYYLEYLAEFLFKRAYDYTERIETFFDVIAEVYPLMLKSNGRPVATNKEEPTTSAED